MRSYFSLKTITKSKYQKELVGSELQRLLVNVESATEEDCLMCCPIH